MFTLIQIRKGFNEWLLLSKKICSDYSISLTRCRYDMAKCFIYYGARATDYYMFEFHKKSSSERNRFMTNLRWIKLLNKCTIRGMMGGGKDIEYNIFRNYIKRDWIIVHKEETDDKIIKFINSHIDIDIIAKPVHGTLGRGVLKLNKQNNVLDILLRERKSDDYILEECVENRPEIKALNPDSLNTIRAFTSIDKNGVVNIEEIILRVGRKGKVVDNWGAGGIIYLIDLKTGICKCPGLDKNRHEYILHPDSNITMVGYILPDFDNLKQYIIELARLIPEARVVGWDIAITPKGFDFIEMNSPGGHDILQAFGIPFWDKFKKLIQ